MGEKGNGEQGLCPHGNTLGLCPACTEEKKLQSGELSGSPSVEHNTDVFVDMYGEPWAPTTYFLTKYGITARTFNKRVHDIRVHEGRSQFQNASFYPVNEVAELLKRFSGLPKVEKESGVYRDEDGLEWAPKYFFIDERFGPAAFKTRAASHKSIAGRDVNNVETRLYAVPDIQHIKKAFLELPLVEEETGIYVDEGGVEWIPIGSLAKKVKITDRTLRKKIKGVASIKGRDRIGKEVSLFSYQDALNKLESHLDLPQVENETEIYNDENGEQWATAPFLAERYGIDRETVSARKSQIRFILGRDKSGKETSLYNFADAELVLPGVGYTETRSIRPRESSELAPADWVSLTSVLEGNEGSSVSLSRLTSLYIKYPEHLKLFTNPKTGKAEEYCHPDVVGQIRNELSVTPEVVPDGWMTIAALARLIGRDHSTVSKRAKKFRVTRPDLFGFFQGKLTDKIDEYLHPTLVEILKEELKEKTGETRQIKNKLGETIKEIAEGGSMDAKAFWKMVAFCGAGHAADILFKFRPEYKSIPIEYVKRVLAEYLGDYLAAKRPFNFKDAKEAAEYMSDLTLKEGMVESLKQNCLSFYYEERRVNPTRSDREIIEAYLDYAIHELGDLKNADVDDVVEQVVLYFSGLFTNIERPANMVSRLKEGRDFPDVNQRINMRELKEKKRMLIADEMGLGKSGSSVFAKEALGVKQALLVVPSNVIPTWQNYLSSGPERGGYFRPGEEPRVLVVEHPEALKAADIADDDYIIISHERLTDRYAEDLQSLDFGMMIVDEAHLLKNMGGKRAGHLVKLSKKLEGDDKYLALLSGTPVPNTVDDVAMILRMLYPEKFEQVEEKKLVAQIVQGDILDLRSLLLPRMQMKSLRESVEMPALREELREVELTPAEKVAYEMLLEEDELSPTEKMQLLRRFLLNPELVDPTPGIESAKLKQVNEELREAFGKHDKVMMFVNGYIEDVIRGELDILKKLDLPGVEIVTIHGEVSKEERQRIQRQVKEAPGKMLLVMSGQTAGVGVDFSSMDDVFFFNEPWTEYDRQQQLSRVYRPGLDHELHSRTFVAKGTLEEGIHRHVQAKFKSIEKLLRGIPLTELEQEMLKRSKDGELPPGAEVDPELAKYYFSSWDRMMSIFNYVKEIGETDFQKFLEKFAREYAECYMDLGSRSYQANANRVSGAVIGQMIEQARVEIENVRILDLASGPEMLRRHIADGLQERVVSLDLNAAHFAPDHEKRFAGSFLNTPFEAGSFDYTNMALAWHYTSFAPSKGQHERLQVLHEMNRVLRDGGRSVINMIYSLDVRDEQQFREAVGLLGFEIVEDFSGEAQEGTQYASRVITLQKVRDLTQSLEEIIEALRSKDLLNAFKFKQTEKKLKDSRRIVTGVELNGRRVDVKFNAADQRILYEEQAVTAEGRALKAQHGSVEKIPKEIIIARKFVRINIGKRYVLFKKLVSGPGAVIVK